jgi:hypothetical protein
MRGQIIGSLIYGGRLIAYFPQVPDRKPNKGKSYGNGNDGTPPDLEKEMVTINQKLQQYAGILTARGARLTTLPATGLQTAPDHPPATARRECRQPLSTLPATGTSRVQTALITCLRPRRVPHAGSRLTNWLQPRRVITKEEPRRRRAKV